MLANSTAAGAEARGESCGGQVGQAVRRPGQAAANVERALWPGLVGDQGA
ncbi:hypothetical protein ACIBCN_23790 [Nocardia sp. NPDC051052]